MARILIIDDDSKICLFLKTLLHKMGHETFTANRIDKGKKLSQANKFDLVLLDLELPDGNGLDIMPDLINAPYSPEVIIITGTGDVRGAEMAFKYDAWDYVQKPFNLDEVTLPIKRALAYRREKLSSRQLVPLVRTGIVGESAAIRKCLEEVANAASTDASILITGETGTGKELFSRAIHENSRRASGPFIAVDCGALPDTLIESTLFGHEKGAFTGAAARQDGLVVQANGGTLMLDEVGDMPLSVQKTFLRTLQERKVRPIGGKKEIAVDIRLVAATNLDLDQMVENSLFREDLLYRIRAIEIKLPPLRERGKDIKEIVYKKIHELSNHYNIEAKAISPDFMAMLTNHEWPGNVRELINVLEHSLASAGKGPTLVPKHLPPQYRLKGISFKSPQQDNAATLPDIALNSESNFPKLYDLREKLEKEYLTELLDLAKGDRKKASRLSGVSQSRLYSLLRKYNLPGFGS